MAFGEILTEIEMESTHAQKTSKGASSYVVSWRRLLHMRSQSQIICSETRVWRARAVETLASWGGGGKQKKKSRAFAVRVRF